MHLFKGVANTGFASNKLQVYETKLGETRGAEDMISFFNKLHLISFKPLSAVVPPQLVDKDQ